MRRDLAEISDLYSCWDPQVNEEDLHHSVAVHVGDLKTRVTACEWVQKKYVLKNSEQYDIPILSMSKIILSYSRKHILMLLFLPPLWTTFPCSGLDRTCH